jgi:hypothetical protein
MKRLALAVASSLTFMTITAATALAQSSDYPPSPATSPTTSVAGTSGSTGTAFTGADLSFGTIALAVLFIAGMTALLVARKRAARLAV